MVVVGAIGCWCLLVELAPLYVYVTYIFYAISDMGGTTMRTPATYAHIYDEYIHSYIPGICIIRTHTRLPGAYSFAKKALTTLSAHNFQCPLGSLRRGINVLQFILCPTFF